MAFDSTPHSTEYLASAYALHGADTAMSRDDHPFLVV